MARASWLLRIRGSAAVALLIAAIAVSVAATQNAGAPSGDTQAKALAEARQMLSDASYDEALSMLNGVLQDKPDNGEARFLKGLALAHSGQKNSALKLFEALSQDFPDMAEAWNNLGVLRARTGNLDGARKALNRATQLNPDHVAARQNLGDVYVALAQRAYQQAGTLAPDNQVVQRKVKQLAQLLSANGMSGEDTATTTELATNTPMSDAPPAKTRAESQQASSGQASSARTTHPTAGQPTRVASAGPPEITTARAMAGSIQDRPTPKQVIRTAVQDWADAWSTQNLEAYFAAYSPQFDPHGARTIQQWRALRVRRVRSPEWITVAVNNMDIMLTGADTATVKFDQAYESDTYQDQVRKTLTLVHTRDGWLIKTES